MLLVRGNERPRAPWDVVDAVQLWAREHGRTGAQFTWMGGARCFCIEFDLKADDPRMKGWQEGRLARRPTEKVWLHRPNGKGHYEPMDLAELGASGVRSLLDEGNTWTGTGRYRSLNAAIQAVEDRNERLRQQIKDVAVENARLHARDDYRSAMGNPLVAVPDTLES